MSIRALNWANEVVVGDSTAKFTLVIMAGFADERGTCFPGQDLLARIAEVSDRSVRRAISILEERGFIAIERTRREDGRLGGNRYRLNMDGPHREAIAGKPAEVSSGGPAEDTSYGPPEVYAHTTGSRLPVNNHQIEPIERERARDDQKTANLVGSADTGFDGIMAGWPNVAIDDREAAWLVYCQLTPSERIEACRGIPRVVNEFSSKGRKYLPGLAKVLRERRWQALTPPKSEQTQLVAQAHRVFVAKDTPAWRAWQRYRKGRPMPVRHSSERGADGWEFPSEFPPDEIGSHLPRLVSGSGRA